MRASNELILNIADISSGGPFTSVAIPANQMLSISAQAVGTGTTPGGTLKMQASDDPSNPTTGGTAPANWTDITGATATVAAANTPVIMPKVEVCYGWVRFVFTTSGGSGPLTVRAMSQGL